MIARPRIGRRCPRPKGDEVAEIIYGGLSIFPDDKGRDKIKGRTVKDGPLRIIRVHGDRGTSIFRSRQLYAAFAFVECTPPLRPK